MILPLLLTIPAELVEMLAVLLLMAATTEVRLTEPPPLPPLPAAVEMVWIPAELVAMPVLAEVEIVWMPAELVAMPVLAPVETV